MKRFIVLSCLLIFSIYGYAQHVNEFDKEFEEAHDENSYRARLAQRQQQTNPLSNDYDLKYHRLEWSVDPKALYISGKITSYFTSLKDNFSVLNFDASSALVIDSVFHQGQKLNYASNNDVLTITLNSPLSSGQLDSVSVYYHGVPVKSGFDSFMIGTHGDNKDPELWTLSEPYGAKDWWPCKQVLYDKIDSIDVIVTTPDLYRVAGNGLLVSEVQQGTDKVFHWKHRYPISSYLIAIAVTNFEQYTNYFYNGKDSLPILNYVYPEELDLAKYLTPDIIPVMALYDSLFGAYPFAKEKYGHAHFGWRGGMEHQTMSFVADFSHALMAHELAHQWFGDKLTCSSWKDIWLNESFATFLTGLTYEHLSDAATFLRWKNEKINNVISSPNGSVYVDDTTSVGRIFSGRLSYDKGAMVLHMLRWEMGDEPFFRAIKNYITDKTLTYNYVNTTNLKLHFEKVSGQNLDKFFTDWIYGQGYPSYHFRYVQKENNEMVINVRQTPSDPSVSFYQMDLPVLLKNKVKDTLIVLHNVQSDQNFTVPVGFKIDSLLFDPDKWILSGNNTIEDISYTLKPFTVRPNPAKGSCIIYTNTLNYNPDKVYTVEFITVLGSISKRIYFDHAFANVDISDLRTGIYFVKFYEDDKYYVEKVLISN